MSLVNVPKRTRDRIEAAVIAFERSRGPMRKAGGFNGKRDRGGIPEEGGAVDLKNSGTTVVEGATSIDIPAASSAILSFSGTAPAGTLSLVSGGTGTYKGIFWSGSAWVIDYPRLHS